MQVLSQQVRGTCRNNTTSANTEDGPAVAGASLAFKVSGSLSQSAVGYGLGRFHQFHQQCLAVQLMNGTCEL